MMTPEFFLILVLVTLALAFLAWGLVVAVRFYLKYRGQRLIVCPETQRPAAVEVAAARGAAQLLFSTPDLQLRDCSRWPEREDCGQECLAQIDAAPHDCLVWNIVNRWYEGQVCAYCRAPFREIHWHDHRPALRDEDGKTVQWTDVPAERLPIILATHQPVCWNCHIAESFRREHPDMVVDRPWRRAG